MTIAAGARVEAHPHRPKVLKYRAGEGSDLTVSVRVIPRGHVQYAALLILQDAEFKVQPAGPKRVREVTKVRDVHAFVRGTVVACFTDEGDSAHFKRDFLDTYPAHEWCLVSYNPFKADHFYEVLPQADGGHEAGRQITSAQGVVMVGGDLYAIHPTFQETS